MNSSCFVLDTGFVCSLLNFEDANHDLAADIFEKLDSSMAFFIPETVRLELALIGLSDSEFALTRFESLFDEIGAEYVSIDNVFVDDFRDFVFETKFKLKVIDYTVLYTSFLKRAELLTFDKKLKQFAESLN